MITQAFKKCAKSYVSQSVTSKYSSPPSNKTYKFWKTNLQTRVQVKICLQKKKKRAANSWKKIKYMLHRILQRYIGSNSYIS